MQNHKSSMGIQNGQHHHTERLVHSHHHGCGHCHRPAEGNILVAFLLNLGFAIVEVIGGLLTGSISILSDALHDFGDSISLGFAWYLERIAGRGRDHKFSYGYQRFSLLSALFISVMLIVGSVFVIQTAIEKMINPTMPDASGMFLLALFGIGVNGYAAWRMHSGGSISERAIKLHLMEDVLGWAAVLVVSIIMYFVELPILDPLLSLAITGWILYNVFFTLRDSFRILLQGVPHDVDARRFIQQVEAINGVVGTHDLHLWTLNGEENIASLHIVHSTDRCDAHSVAQLKNDVRHLAIHHNIHHITIELDPEGSSCGMETC